MLKMGIVKLWTVYCLSTLIYCQFGSAGVTTISHLSTSDKSHLQSVFTSNIESKDLGSIHYAILGLKILNVPIPKQKEVCKNLLDASKSAITADNIFYVSSSWKSLAKCEGTLPSADLAKKLDVFATKDSASLADIYYSTQGQKILGQKPSDLKKVVQNIKNALKKDDSLLNVGYAFNIAAGLGSDGAFMFDRIEDVVVQADEVDGKYLQFEGGLSTTALIVSGIYQLAQSLNKAPVITSDQAVKFANYFVSRKSVSTSKGAYFLLNVANILSTNKYHIPVAITLESGVAVSLEQPYVKVAVTNIFGNPLPNTLTVTVESATKVQSNVVVASKLKFTPVANSKSLFAVNFLENKPEPGSYKFSVSATPTPADSKLIGNIGTPLNINVMCWVALKDVSIGTVDVDRTTKPKLETVTYPNKLSSTISADSQQRIILQFGLVDKQTTKPTSVHQTFVKFTNIDTKQEVILVAEQIPDHTYKFDVDLGAKSSAFGHISGTYTISLIVGDAIVSNSFVYDVANANLKFSKPATESTAKAGVSKQMFYKPKPEIKHLFREPEARPPVAVSMFFTAAVLVPFLVLFGLWTKLGVNISNCPWSISALGFHTSLGGIFGIYFLFWSGLYTNLVGNMFDTLTYLSFLLFLTFISGNKLLSYIASSKK